MDREFLRFLLRKVWAPGDVEMIVDSGDVAFGLALADARHRTPALSENDILKQIVSNTAMLAVFLYRLGRELYRLRPDGAEMSAIHWLMRECCACEIYFSSDIGTGFQIVHGVGTVIGSRNRIGSGFSIYQGCTVGHIKSGGKGATIGNNVTLYAGSKILGEISVGDDVVVGSQALVLSDVAARSVCTGIAAGSADSRRR